MIESLILIQVAKIPSSWAIAFINTFGIPRKQMHKLPNKIKKGNMEQQPGSCKSSWTTTFCILMIAIAGLTVQFAEPALSILTTTTIPIFNKNEVPNNWLDLVKNPREPATDEHFDLAKTWLKFDPNMHLPQDRSINRKSQPRESLP